VDGSEGDSQVGSHSKGEEGESIDGRGRAAIAKAAREKEEARIRSSKLAQTTKNGALNILKVCPDAMTARGASSFAQSLRSCDKEEQLASRAEAVAWFREAAEVFEHREAKLLLAGCLYESNEKDHDGSVRWLTEAMEEQPVTDKGKKKKKKKKKKSGTDPESDTQTDTPVKEWKGIGGEANLQCLTNLGECYYHGEGVKRDRPEAAKLYRKAAELGYPAAQANLAEMLSTGEGVVKDLDEAAKWFAAGASAGLMEAQFGLGHAYERGEGVPKNLAMAAFWYETAATQGHGHAASALEHLEEKMQAKAKATN